MSGTVEISALSNITFVFQLTLGIVFLLSVLPKFHRPLTFAKNVIEYKILPGKVAYVFALALIPLEAFLTISFLTGWLLKVAFPLVTVMLIAFLVAVGVNLRRGRRIQCGCFGNTNEQISPGTLARLLLLLTVVLLLIAFRSTGGIVLLNFKVIGITSTLTYLLQATSLAVFLILVAAWILSLPELVLLFRHLLRDQLSSGHTRDGQRVEGT